MLKIGVRLEGMKVVINLRKTCCDKVVTTLV
jgi:hypothetical protein